MPSFKFNGPNGQSYTMNAPEGATAQQAYAMLQQHLSGSQAAVPQVPTPQTPAGPQADTTPFKAPSMPFSPNPSTVASEGLTTLPGISPLVQLAHYITSGKGVEAPVGGDHTPSNVKAAQGAGVDTTTGAPKGNFAAAYAPSATMRYQVYQKNNPNLQWRMGAQSGEPEYFNPATKRWTLAQPNAAENAIPSTVQGTGQIAGALAGTAVGALGGPGLAGTGSVVGSAFGNAAGKVATNFIGKEFGALPSNMLVTQGTGMAALSGGLSDFAGQAALGIGKYFKYITQGKRMFSDADAQLLVNAQKRAQSLIQKIRLGANMAFNPDAAQIALAPNSGVSNAEATFKAVAARQSAAGNEDARIQVAQNQGQNEAALKAYFDNLLVNHQLGGLNPQTASQNVATGLTNPFHVAQAAAKQAIAQLPADAQREQAATITRAALQSAHDNFENTVEKPAWNAYQQATGYDALTHSSNIQVPWSQNVKNLMAGWTAEDRKALVGLVGQDSARLQVNFGEGTPDLFSTVLDSNGNPFLLKKGEAPQGADLADVDSAIKWLRQTARTRMSGQQGVVLPTAKLNQLSGALADMRNSYLEQAHPQIKDLLDVAEGASRQKAGQFGTGLLDTVLTKGGDGQPRLTDLESLDRILGTPDQATIKPVTDIIKGNPLAKDQLNQYLLARYRDEVVNPDTGIPNYTLHKQFMNKYGAFIQNVFDQKDLPQIGQIGGLAKQVIMESKKLRAFMPRLFTNPDGSVEALNPTNIISGMLGKGASLVKTQKMIGNMKQYPYAAHTFEQWRAAAADFIHSQLTRDGKFLPGKLSSLLSANNGENLAVIEKLFNTDGQLGGTKLVNGLKTLHEGSQLAENLSIGGANPDQTNLLQRGLRTYFHPFSDEGRIMDFLRRERVRTNPQVLYNMLSDPDVMAREANHTKRLIGTIRNIGVGAGIANNVSTPSFGSSVPQARQQGQGNGSY